ncbi:MAG: LexA family transcriptional regulator [Candidatus Azobacteroides sp.]|jgi:phage repressor protein C with HTH and peptisase S24 domain|nr:LexA family transcriptional regulator [Candidatus Azobacteroides sp.]
MQEKKQKNTDISARISQIVENEGISPNAFAQKLGYERAQTIYDILNGKSAPSFDFFNRFENSEFSERYHLTWIVSGKGEMSSANNPKKTHLYPMKTDRKEEMQSIPLYNLEAVAGLVPLFETKNSLKPMDYINIPDAPKCDGAVYVVGDSMYPLLKSGDIILYKEIHDIVNNIFWGEMYLLSIDLEGDEYITVKYIQKSEEKNCVKLVSQNQHHASKDIPISGIKALALIKASIRFNTLK